MPPAKRQAVLSVAPTARRAIDHLHKDGEHGMAAAVQIITDFAVATAQAQGRKAERDKESARNRSINVGMPFRTHVYAAAEEMGVDLARFVRDKLADFVEGVWVPEKPGRAGHGQAPEKGFVNVRVADGLWDLADSVAKDAAASEERGYSLNARQVVIAALHEEFPMPKKETTAER